MQSTLTVLVVILRTPNSLVHVLCDAGLYMAFDQARLCPGGVDLDPPSFVHLGSCLTPGMDVEHGIQALDEDDAVGGRNDDCVGRGVFERVIKGGGVHDRGWVAQAGDEVDVGGCVEGPMGPATVVCAFGVVHGVELGAGEVPAVEPDEDRLGPEFVDEAGGKRGFSGCGDACDGDEETRGRAGAYQPASRLGDGTHAVSLSTIRSTRTSSILGRGTLVSDSIMHSANPNTIQDKVLVGYATANLASACGTIAGLERVVFETEVEWR